MNDGVIVRQSLSGGRHVDDQFENAERYTRKLSSGLGHGRRKSPRGSAAALPVTGADQP